MAPAPAPPPPMTPTAASAVGGEDEGARDQNTVVSKSKDASMVVDGDLPVPCSEPAGGPEVTPEPVEDKGGDTTESSSSFGGTCSGFDDEADAGEPEVSSQALPPTEDDRASMLPRRKKVTAEWRNAIRPTMWRFQWLELRMRDLSSQVSRYDRELALIQKEKEKELQQAVSKTNGSMPDVMLTVSDHRNSSMERRKRKRDEDITDTALYIKKHPILSHYNDKQTKGAETDALVLDDDCDSAGGHDTVALLDAEEYDVIFEQVSLKDILSTIDGVQSQIRLLKDRLNKAHLEQDNLAFSEENTLVRVPRKRQSTQKFCDTSYMNYQNTKLQKYRNVKPQKKKNLNILLKDDDGPALAAKPGFQDRGANYQIEDAKGNSGEQSGEWNRPHDRAITMDLLLGVDNSLPNGHMGDLCKENADDILIDNRTANEGCPHFPKIEHLPFETDSKGENVSAPVEVETSAPVKVDGISSALKVDITSDTVVQQEPLLEKSPMLKPVKKRGWKPRERKNVWGSDSSSINHSKGASATSDSELKSNGAPPAKEKTENTPTVPMDLEIMTPLAAWKKRKAGNKSEEHKTGNLASKKQKTGMSAGNKSAAAVEHKEGNLASKNQKTGKPSSGTKKRKSENSPAAAKKQETENSSPAAKKQEIESTPSKVSTSPPSKLMVEKAVLVAVNSRRSQRVRKPKVY